VIDAAIRKRHVVTEEAARERARIRWYRRWWAWLFIVAGLLMVIASFIPTRDGEDATETDDVA
jgi:hypothetical protein